MMEVTWKQGGRVNAPRAKCGGISRVENESDRQLKRPLSVPSWLDGSNQITVRIADSYLASRLFGDLFGKPQSLIVVIEVQKESCRWLFSWLVHGSEPFTSVTAIRMRRPIRLYETRYRPDVLS
jgi:hypothetical protein